MNKVYFHLPKAFEQYIIYNTLIPIFKKERNKFYDYIELGSIYGSSNLLIWNGEYSNSKDTFLPLQKSKKFYYDNDISVSIVASNLLLDEKDLYNATANYFINEYHNKKNEIVIGSDILKRLIDKLYPKYIKVSSESKNLTKQETLDELDNGYERVILNVTLNRDYDFLYSLTDAQKKKIEIILNPTCINYCGHNREHNEAISHDILYRDMTAIKYMCEWQNKNFIENIQSPHTIKNDELIEKYIKFGFNNFKIIDRNANFIDIIFTLAYYLIKPEYYLDIIYRMALPIFNKINPSQIQGEEL